MKEWSLSDVYDVFQETTLISYTEITSNGRQARITGALSPVSFSYGYGIHDWKKTILIATNHDNIGIKTTQEDHIKHSS